MKVNSLIYKFILLWLIFNVCCVKVVDAQVDTIMSYMKLDRFISNNAGPISVKDSIGADFVRMVTSPDVSSDNMLYQVYDYFLNGKLKLRASSAVGSFQVRLEGPFIEYYPNGHKKRVAGYKGGKLNGDFIDFFPNGEIYLSGTYYDNVQKIEYCNDDSGSKIVSKGTGQQILYDDNLKPIGGGAIVDGRRNGLWKDVLNDSVTYEAQYRMGEISSGTSYDKQGNKYYFTKAEVMPGFPGGIQALINYMTRTVRYPAAARENNIRGRVILSFVVNKTGTVQNIKVARGIGGGCDEAAVEALRKAPSWHPGLSYGMPVNVLFSIPVSFN